MDTVKLDRDIRDHKRFGVRLHDDTPVDPKAGTHYNDATLEKQPLSMPLLRCDCFLEIVKI